MRSLIVYTPEQLDMSKLEEYYADLEINPKEHFNNMKRTNTTEYKYNGTIYLNFQSSCDEAKILGKR